MENAKMQPQLSTGSESSATGATGEELLGAFTLGEFCDRFRISRGKAYKERVAGRLRFAKVGTKTIITRTEARRYQQALDTAAGAPEAA
jgi:hypothetical protein